MDLLITDADNTLWDTNAVYAQAQLQLLADVEEHLGASFDNGDRLSFVREVDQELALAHSMGLRYPAPLLVAELLRRVATAPTAITRTSQTLRHNDEASLVSQALAERMSSAIRSAVPQLRSGVRTGLEQLRMLGIPITVFTEGDQSRCQNLLKRHGLDEFCSRVVSGKKTSAKYRELANESTGLKVMIGDQIDVDIVFAKNAEFFTIYYPSDFRPVWTLEHDTDPDATIASYADVGTLVALQLDR